MQNYGIFTEMGESHRSLNRAIDAESQDIASKMGLFVQNRSVLFSLGPFFDSRLPLPFNNLGVVVNGLWHGVIYRSCTVK